jgi:N-methylhydantoinase B
VFETAGAGGWGDPLLRPAESVRVDAEKGFVSAEVAGRDYGVLLAAAGSGYCIDEDATARLRRERAKAAVPLFDLGPRPAAYTATVENPEIPPLGPEQVIAPRPIDAGLLDSRE